MSVHILYKGRLGNHLFQYVAARLMARRNGLKLATPFPHPQFVTMTPHEDGDWVELSKLNVMLDDEDDILAKRPRGRFILDGYFQDSERCHALRGEILGFAKATDTPDERHADDIVVSLRVGPDYRSFGWIIDPSWYIEILEGLSFKRLHIVMDHVDVSYLDRFRKWNPIVVTQGPLGDWNYLRGFRRMLLSNSTFAWWGAYFSNAETIYTFKKWVGHSVAKLGKFPNGIEVDGHFLGKG